MKGPPPEFGSVKGKNSRLWLSIKGEKTCLAALYPELIALEMDVAVEGEMLTAMAPIAANIDQLLSAISAAVDRTAPGPGLPPPVRLNETRMVTALPDAGQTICLGGRFRIIPAGGGERATDDVILLTASTVFGSGLHPSTRLAVQALAALAGKVQVFPERVLDVGTGSGILAMIAARLGARHVKAVDVCPEAVAVARRNVAVNGLGDLVGIEAACWGRLAGPFDLIIANLTISVHLRLADHLDGILGSGGELLISGMQGRQQGEIEEYWRAKGLRTVAGYAEENWRALRLRKP